MSETRKLTEQLIEIPSVTPVDGGCQHLIAERLKQQGFKIEYLDFEDVSNLWAVIGDTGPLFTFVGHTDVVPASAKEWSSDPFVATEKDIKIYGVEVEDSACLVEAIKADKRVRLREVGLFADGVAVELIGKNNFDLNGLPEMENNHYILSVDIFNNL